MAIRVSYRDRLSQHQAEYVLEKLLYQVEGITDCRVDAARGEMVMQSHPDQAGAVVRALEALMTEARAFTPPPARALRATTPRPPCGTFSAQMWRDPRVRETEAVAMRSLDAWVWQLASAVGAEARQYPSMIAGQTMERCHYFTEFPQDIYWLYESPHDREALRFASDRGGLLEMARPTGYMMSPAICYHCYAELAGQQLVEPVVLTAGGSCFRHEAPARLDAWRLLEFHMREIVFLGTRTYVESLRQRLMEQLWTGFEAMGLSGCLQTASDPFYFASEAMKADAQVRDGTKYELCVHVSDSHRVALASFNHLGQALTAPFGIVGDQGAPLYSGCVGVGLERWARALIVYHGADLGAWPPALRQMLKWAD